MPSTYDVVVIGAGITGASTAFHLRRLGIERVLLIERATPASGGTGKSAAIVRQHYSTPLMSRMALESLSVLEDIEGESPGAFAQVGWFMLVPPELMDPAARILDMQRGVGVQTGFLPQTEIAQRMPWLDPEGVGGVIHEPTGGYADPTRVTETLVARFEREGGEVRLRTPCRALIRDGDRVTGVLLDDGPIAAGAVVNAAGPWAKPLAEQAEIPMPLRAVREQDSVWEARGDRPLPEQSVSNAVDAIYVRPLGNRRFVIGQGFPKEYVDVDPYNYRESADDSFISLMLERATRRFPPFQGMRLITSYAALYDVTPDWYQFIGPRRGLDGYFDACGGSGHGFKEGPAIGAHLAQWIHDGVIDEEFAQFSHDRIEDRRLFTGAYGGNRG